MSIKVFLDCGQLFLILLDEGMIVEIANVLDMLMNLVSEDNDSSKSQSSSTIDMTWFRLLFDFDL